MISTKNISLSLGGRKILTDITTTFESGLLHVLVGPNGSGKSSFLKIFGGEYKADRGSVFYGDVNLLSIDKANLARKRAVMSQQTTLGFPLAVEEVVMMGRYPYFNVSPSEIDKEICTHLLRDLHLTEYIHRNYLTLSGGEKQRVQFARVLAQLGTVNEYSGKYLFLDEAIAGLDIKYQHQLLQMVKGFCAKGLTVIAILHELNIALQYADQLFFMKSGQLVEKAIDKTTLSNELLSSVFGIGMRIEYMGEERKAVVIVG